MAAVPYNTNLPRSTLGYTIPLTGGTTTGVTVGTSSIQVIGQSSSRRKITFHNPNIGTNANIFVCQAVDAAGNALTAGDGLPGSIAIFPGASLTFDGECGMAFNAKASAVSSGLTIIESQVPSQS